MNTNSENRVNSQICLPFYKEEYLNVVDDKIKFRAAIEKYIEIFPELFPEEISKGFELKDIRTSIKLSIKIRRIKIGKTAFTIRPSFIMPYMTGLADEVDKGLYLRKYDVPFHAIAHVLGKDHMYWYRLEQALGRNNIVGTTVKNPDNLPKHLAADEKHTRIKGEKAYVATTVAEGCILGASIAKDAGEVELTKAYGVFKDEIQCIHPEYKPETVNIDGWKATHKAWNFLFSSTIIICCFLHVYIKIRDRSKKKYKERFKEVATKLWDCYNAETKTKFSQRIRRLNEWCQNEKNDVPEVIAKPIKKLKDKLKYYSAAYDHPGAHRTSNMIDRLMQRMDRHLFNTQYFHGIYGSAELGIRGWALIQNFAPSNPNTIKKYKGLKSPAERINKFRYHDNWLQNLLISASLGGDNRSPQNPL